MAVDVAPLKGQVNVLDLASRDTTLRRVASTDGGEYAGPCPFCGGRDRFRVWPGKGSFWCRGCGERGDVISYMMKRDNLTFREAVARLGGTPPPARQPVTGRVVTGSSQVVTTRPEPPRWRQAGEKIVELCHEFLLRDPKTLDYLHRRGLRDETIKAFRLGRNDIPRRYGLEVPIGWTIPLVDPNGMFYGILVRRDTTEKERRYQEVPGSHHPLMGRLTGKPALLITEGAFDMMLAWQEVGDLLDVATLGSCDAKPDPWVIHLLPYQRILVCYDLDDAGERGRRHWSRFSNVLQVRLPMDRSKGKDVTDYVLSGGDLRKWLQPLLPGQEQTKAESVPLCPAVETGTGPYRIEQKPMKTAAVNPKGYIWRLAKRHGFPRLRLCAWESVLPGEENWRTFLTYASAKDLERATAALSGLETAEAAA